VTLALAKAAPSGPGELDWVLALVDMPELERRGWDPRTRRLVPSPTDPLFGYARCPVRGCENVTEHTATTLCARCQNHYGRWLRTHEDGGIDGFLASATQIRSEDPARLYLVCRTPGHERPVHSGELCDSCHASRARRGQSITAYMEGDARYRAALPRVTFGRCVLGCDALARGNERLCFEHWRQWRRVGAPREAAFDRWASLVERRLQAARFRDLSGLPERMMVEMLVGLTVSIARPRRCRITDLRRVINRLREAGVGSILEIDARKIVSAYAFRHSYAQRHADNGTPVDVLAELMGHANMNTTQGYYTVRDARKRKAVEALAPLQIDCHGNQRIPVVARLLASERLRQQIGQTAVPMGHCTEPSNVKAGGHSCPYRHQCFGCEHFRTDPSSQPELRDYLHKLLLDRERLAGAVPALADWAQRDATPSEQEITAVRALIRRNDEVIDQLDPADRAAVIDAIAVTRRVRAQLASEIPARFRLATSQPRPTLSPRVTRTQDANP